MGKKAPTPKHVVGWTELVALPEWNIPRLEAKVDTGARTSALHVENLRRLSDGKVSFDVIVGRKRRRSFPVTAPVVKWGLVRSSSGEETERPFVTVKVRIGPVVKEVEVSLVSRDSMIFRMLLGRTALAEDFLVDAGRRRILSPSGKKKEMKE